MSHCMHVAAPACGIASLCDMRLDGPYLEAKLSYVLERPFKDP